MNFANGDPALALPAGAETRQNEVTGLFYHTGLLYVALRKRNLIARV